MRKFLFIILALSLITGCSLNDKKSWILKNIEINKTLCKIEKEIDTHRGFHGDGDYFAKINCSSINYDKLSSNWKKLPLSDSLKQVTQMEQCTGDDCKNIYERFFIPSIENGYYYFLDRHSASENKYDDTNLNNRASWNYTLAIIDKNTDIIYYYELDT